MADGSRKPIKDVKLSDKVLATDPTTGRTEAREITDVRSQATSRTLVEVTVDGNTGTDRGTVVTTDEHPFWVASENRWSNAIDLKPGHKITTADNRDATVTGTRSWSEVRRVYNLTVDTTHTYYVFAGTSALLTHNDPGCKQDPTWGGAVKWTTDGSGRPTTMSATLTKQMIGEGTSADSDIRPPGFAGGRPIGDHARGHLLGKQLGGSGDIAENLVTLFQNPVNTPVMSGFEGKVRKAVEGGEIVQYTVTALYDGSNVLPRGVTLSAHGDSGFNLNVTEAYSG